MMRPAVVGVAVLGTVAALVLIWFFWFRSAPQLGPDPEARRTADALFTAVTARDPKRLEQCAQRLDQLKQAGKLPDAAANYLDGVVKQARAGDWEPAAQRLYDFALDQRYHAGK